MLTISIYSLKLILIFILFSRLGKNVREYLVVRRATLVMLYKRKNSQTENRIATHNINTITILHHLFFFGCIFYLAFVL